jgi:hypothetical protein
MKNTTCQNEKIVYFSRVKTTGKKKKKGTVGWTDGTQEEASVQASEQLVHWVKEAQFTQTVGWTGGVFSSCTGWIEEEKPRRQEHRMNRWSIGGNRQSIRWSNLNKTETRQNKLFSTGWTDALGQRKSWSIWRSRSSIQRRFGCEAFNTGWTDAPSVYSVEIVVSTEMQRLCDVEGTGWTDTLENHSTGSSNAYFFSGC